MTVNHTPARSQTGSVALIRNWPVTFLSAGLLPLLLALGFWQLDRADEKAQILATIDARLSAQPKNPSELTAVEPFIPVRLMGFYTGELFYLDNRTRDGQVGYEVLQVFVSGGKRWLVNRGWVPAGEDRAQVPAVAWPLAAKWITGFLHPADAEGPAAPMDMEFETGAGVEPERLQRIQAVAADLLDRLELEQPDWTIRLSADSDTALRTGWQFVNGEPARHRGYAFQWFAMAAALCILWLIAASNIPAVLKKNNYKRGNGS
ncbi:SURF1 family protein [Microbulbifer guangxiensis]|uniref:SURF1 family protein n=1 Tax=Microbulbifer guangxiensis TaxID=2904249 RepID=UPI001F24D228|nr:SURF1 family protein [Microbulbifer guangxiensis]